jgi:hypothetical protein
VPKLKEHILPRIKTMLMKETASNADAQPQAGLSSVQESNNYLQERDSVHFKNDRMYSHHLARFNYTTYDVRRAQDVVNPSTPHCDIILLANTHDTDNGSSHPFLYARILGIYHVNVIYNGEGMLDYSARKVDFLWVRWFRYDGHRSVGWNDLKLDSVNFPPMAVEGAFGFVDPADVLRGCHILPVFPSGKVHSDLIGLSGLARDAHDWRQYRVNRCVYLSFFFCFLLTLVPRFVDRDMIMRYHQGMAIGHVYTHGLQNADVTATSDPTAMSPDTGDDAEPEIELEANTIDPDNPDDHVANHESDSDVDDPERELENWEDDLMEEDEDCEDDLSAEYDDDALFVSMDDMYGPYACDN